MTFPATGCTLAMSRSGVLDSVIESFDMVAGRNVELNDPSYLIAVVSLKKMLLSSTRAGKSKATT